MVRKKQLKYAHLDPGHIFTPIAIESSGVFGTETLKFLVIALNWLLERAPSLQRLSVAVQRGNAASYGFFGLRADGGFDFLCVTYVYL